MQVQHDRTAFSCGIAQVDNYFHKTVNKLAQADTIRLGMMVDAKKMAHCSDFTLSTPIPFNTASCPQNLRAQDHLMTTFPPPVFQ